MTQPDLKPLPCVPGSPFVLVPLHQFPEFTFPCATLLNMEWPRSRQSRLNGLWSCSRHFPVAMVLVHCESREVVGFCKVSLIPGTPKACFIQSVVIHPEKRGQGLGSFLMTNVEEYLRGRKMTTLYLSTLGQEKFYSKLGYEECEPLSLYAFGQQSNYSKLGAGEDNDSKKSTSMNGTLKNHSVDEFRRGDKPRSGNNSKHSSKSSKTISCANKAPPPPPPPPRGPFGGIMTIKTFMKKDIVLQHDTQVDELSLCTSPKNHEA